MFRKILLIIAMLMFAQAAPAQANCGKGGGRVVGAVVGGVLGGFLGSKVDRSRNGTAGIIIGGVLGALAGSAIAKSLDKCEREKFATATKTALDSPASGPTAQQEWTSETRKGVSGTVIANPIVKQADGRVCRSVRRVNYIDGKEMSDAPTFCQMPPDKAWTEQAA